MAGQSRTPIVVIDAACYPDLVAAGLSSHVLDRLHDELPARIGLQPRGEVDDARCGPCKQQHRPKEMSPPGRPVKPWSEQQDNAKAGNCHEAVMRPGKVHLVEIGNCW
jgi:NAD-dependent SIR2 family protein deacetylase